MELSRIENFRLIDFNKAAGDVYFKVGGEEFKAEFIFYLQANKCLSIRVGRHDPSLNTRDLEEYIEKYGRGLREIVRPEVERVKKER
ncbi:hypothetical protein [Thermosyntropha sp.]|uniref:hypothetical protein n=1 Tax=Thermosyntropha sp. TaxID=2740820 RepID=UPI0025F58F46|nr:hypothetical protein [Thermosyntropha sp.]MBO8159595.1 hypothetical protein [Thermosyntropha sp.]